jgi:hypothetical protein
MAGDPMAQLFRDISLVTFGTTTIDEVGAVEVLEGGQEISSTADDATEEQLVDIVELTTTVVVHTKSPAWLGIFAQGAAVATLVVHVNGADSGAGAIYTFTGCRFMGDGAHIAHAEIENATPLRFECQSTNDADPLAVTQLGA